MTDKEKAIVMAYTGACMLSGDKFQIFHKYVEDIMGRPVYIHELADKAVENEIKEKAKADLMALCAEQEPCEDLINRKELDKALYERFHEEDSPNNITDVHLGEVRNFIKNFPSIVNPQEPKIGWWIVKNDKKQGYDIAGVKTWYIQAICARCGFIKPAIEGHIGQYEYCPSCGAKMKEGD